ncbi:glycosyltransferase family 2 protein [Hephaestia sp. GCM10023244]|uniref:glycosyltransferase family 2 protein n=1 Tax=unclassified Hephaestia TaxID=2631281 RepID=UPI0020770387|nr:glycosyltransferase [Hephaestia sp. MAHUQ-44]
MIPTPIGRPARPVARPPNVVGVVVIGRNEGPRLSDSLRSVAGRGGAIVYVDSGSSDDSVARAEQAGAQVVVLAADRPFTAARGRNAGADWLQTHLVGLEFIQFLDGDCLLDPAWIDAALQTMAEAPDAAVVCGRRRERFPDASWYNRLCDIEWDTPIGIVPTCGGDALMRLSAFQDVGGFATELIAGEEPDLCHRLRRAGWTIHRIDHDMSRHDAAMMHFAQWWQRNRRSGYAMAEGLSRRGRDDPRLIRRVASNILWSLPFAWPFWPILWLMILRKHGGLYATFVTLGKLPHCQGQIDFWRQPPAQRRPLIEYK